MIHPVIDGRALGRGFALFRIVIAVEYRKTGTPVQCFVTILAFKPSVRGATYAVSKHMPLVQTIEVAFHDINISFVCSREVNNPLKPCSSIWSLLNCVGPNLREWNLISESHSAPLIAAGSIFFFSAEKQRRY